MSSNIFLLLLLMLYVGCNDGDTLSLKLCNEWEVGSELAMETYLKQFHLTAIGQYIIKNRNQTTYGNLNLYLPQLLIDYHLSKFKLSGASFIESSNILYDSNYGRSSSLGYNRQIVTTYPEMHGLLKNCSTKSDPNKCLLNNLEINQTDSPFNNNQQVMVYNINETYLEFLNLRMPNNTKNIGGYTMEGLAQAVIDNIRYPMFCYEPITDANGSFCYPLCKEVICGENKNCIRSYCPNYVVNTTDNKYQFYFDFINDNKYCVPTTDITMKSDDNKPINKCDNGSKSTAEKLFNYGTLVGFLGALVLVFIMWGIVRASGVTCTKVRSTFISDQLLRDHDQYLL